MTERPILFSAPMVRALLDGSKTQTRRVVKPTSGPHSIEEVISTPDSLAAFIRHHCHSGQTGERLWVRETFVLESCVEHDQLPPFSDGRPIKRRPDEDFEGIAPLWIQPHYRATDPAPELAYEDSEEPACRWKPSIFMPRWASRITLEVTGVRVERLQDISEADAIAEGCVASPFPGPWWQGYRDDGDDLIHQQAIGETPPDWMIEPKRMKDHSFLDRSAKDAYRTLWMNINGVDSWGENPWVWVIEFRRVGCQSVHQPAPLLAEALGSDGTGG